ncbi:large exoprotein [Microbacterium sp.]|uniref:large exoprotein n=1 Tax=Microbacterium sp. TaxID=51671 RepID=UPI003BB18EE8
MGYDDGSGYIGLLIAYGFVMFIVGIAVYVLTSLFLMKIFQKAGVQGAWRAWVPVYNSMVMFKLGDLSPWLVLYGIGGAILLSWIGIGVVFSLALAVLSALAAWRIGLKLQKDAVWVVLYVLLSIVWLGINAFDKSRWNANVAPAPWAGNAFLGDRTVWDGVPTQPSAVAGPAQPGYGAAPQGYAPPAQPGYAAPAQPGYTPPAAPSAPATGAPSVPPVPPTTPQAPPAAPPAPPATPPAPPTTPPAPPAAPPANPTPPPA